MRGEILVTVVGVAVLAACGGGGDATSSELWCGGVCAAVQRCGYRDPTCNTDCVAQRPGLVNRSASGAAAEEPCLAGLSCQAISGDDTAWKTEVDACWQQAKLSVGIRAHVRQFCASYALVWFDCGYTLSLDDCERGFAMWSDEVIDRVALCDAKPACDDFQACETAVFNSL